MAMLGRARSHFGSCSLALGRDLSSPVGTLVVFVVASGALAQVGLWVAKTPRWICFCWGSNTAKIQVTDSNNGDVYGCRTSHFRYQGDGWKSMLTLSGQAWKRGVVSFWCFEGIKILG